MSTDDILEGRCRNSGGGRNNRACFAKNNNVFGKYFSASKFLVFNLHDVRKLKTSFFYEFPCKLESLVTQAQQAHLLLYKNSRYR